MPSQNMRTLWQLHKWDIIKPYKSNRRLPDFLETTLECWMKISISFGVLYSDGKLTGNLRLFSLTHRC